MFTQNMEFLKYSNKTLYDKFSQYRPAKIDALGSPPIDLILNNELFYGADARELCYKQAKMFIASPTNYSISFKSRPNISHIHQVAINRLNIKAEELGAQKSKSPQRSTLVALGSGLGYYLNDLNNTQKFKHIILIEPEDDMLFHFFSSVDLKNLVGTCQQRGGDFNILQSSSLTELTNSLEYIGNQYGYDTFADINLYRHYNTHFFDQTFENFRHIRNTLISGWGYFEDELIGLRNSITNSISSLFASESANRSFSSPALIIGNGPSLDMSLHKLKQAADSHIIVSCGTSLAALVRAGIKPDIHVEMERSTFTAKVQNDWYTKHITDNTLLIALNTVPVSITKKFAKRLLFLKSNDLGGHMLNSEASPKHPALTFCNPTVTNLALSALISLGFRNIGLVGCDFGYRHPTHHHSNLSDYYTENSLISGTRLHAETAVMDNHAGRILTTRILSMSRINIEKVLSRNPEVNCINYSDGAKIDGAPYQSLPSPAEKSLNKKLIIRETINSAVPIEIKISNKLLQSIRLEIAIPERLYSDALRHLELTTNDAATKLSSLLSTLNHALGGNPARTYLYSGLFKYISMCSGFYLSRLDDTGKAVFAEFALDELINSLRHCNDILIQTLEGIKDEI